MEQNIVVQYQLFQLFSAMAPKYSVSDRCFMVDIHKNDNFLDIFLIFEIRKYAHRFSNSLDRDDNCHTVLYHHKTPKYWAQHKLAPPKRKTT